MSVGGDQTQDGVARGAHCRPLPTHGPPQVAEGDLRQQRGRGEGEEVVLGEPGFLRLVRKLAALCVCRGSMQRVYESMQILYKESMQRVYESMQIVYEESMQASMITMCREYANGVHRVCKSY